MNNFKIIYIGNPKFNLTFDNGNFPRKDSSSNQILKVLRGNYSGFGRSNLKGKF